MTNIIESAHKQATSDYKQSAYFKDYASQKLYIVTITRQDGRIQRAELWTREPFRWAKTIAHRLSGRVLSVSVERSGWRHTELVK